MFPLGTIVVTLAAMVALQRSGDCPAWLLVRHASGDRGALCDQDKALNDEAVAREGHEE